MDWEERFRLWKLVLFMDSQIRTAEEKAADPAAESAARADLIARF